MPLLLLAETVEVQHRPDLNVLTVRWLREPPDPVEVRTLYLAVLEAARPYAATPGWLLDVRRRPAPDPGVARWFGEYWLPAAAALVQPRQLRLAYLLSPLRQRATFGENRALQPANERILAPGQPYVVNTFLDEGAAMAWLLT